MMKNASKRKVVTPLETNYMKQQERTMKKNAKRKRLFIRRTALFVVLALTLSYLSISTLMSRNSLLHVKQEEKKQLEEVLASLEKDQSTLENEIVKLHDEEYIKKLARSEYFLSDEGDIIFNIPEKKEDDEEEESSNWHDFSQSYIII